MVGQLFILQQEAAKKRYGRPFIDYLDEAEREMFGQFSKNYAERMVIEMIYTIL